MPPSVPGVRLAPSTGFATWRDWYVACEVPETKAVKNRLHLDLQVSGGRAEPQPARTERIQGTVDRLTAIGAHVLGEHHVGVSLDHVVLADPERNEFCAV